MEKWLHSIVFQENTVLYFRETERGRIGDKERRKVRADGKDWKRKEEPSKLWVT